MALPTTLNALIVVALVFVPGIIFGQLIRRSIAHFPETVDARHFLAMGASGLFLHTLIYPVWTRCVYSWYRNGALDEHWVGTYVWFLVVIFLWPVVAGIGISKLVEYPWVDSQLDKVGMSYVDRTPSAWDYAFLGGGAWVKVYMKDGSVVAGVFDQRSAASVYGRRHDLFLETVYDLNEQTKEFADPVVDTAGAWISQEAISHIEFYKRINVHGDDETRSAPWWQFWRRATQSES